MCLPLINLTNLLPETAIRHTTTVAVALTMVATMTTMVAVALTMVADTAMASDAARTDTTRAGNRHAGNTYSLPPGRQETPPEDCERTKKTPATIMQPELSIAEQADSYPSRRKSSASHTSASLTIWLICISPTSDSRVTLMAFPVFFLSCLISSTSCG